MKLLDFCMFMRYNRFQTKKLLHGSTKIAFMKEFMPGFAAEKGYFDNEKSEKTLDTIFVS